MPSAHAILVKLASLACIGTRKKPKVESLKHGLLLFSHCTCSSSVGECLIPSILEESFISIGIAAGYRYVETTGLSSVSRDMLASSMITCSTVCSMCDRDKALQSVCCSVAEIFWYLAELSRGTVGVKGGVGTRRRERMNMLILSSMLPSF